ncbi:hypothetical protein ACQP1P_33255 [Dactylosporangium sp. CA-052675]
MDHRTKEIGTCTATLPVIGVFVGWQVVLAVTLILGGLALLRLVPRVRG